MKRLLFVFAALLCGALYAGAQDAFDEWGGLYHPYAAAKGPSVKAPRGYKPFYISHIGRHGSRYPVSPDYVGNGLKPLQKADSLGILTPDGKRLMQAFAKLDSVSQGVYGLICGLGAREQQDIARRMAAAYPRVFRQKGRDSVACFSTHKQRAILSMTNFAAALASSAPSVHISFEAGEKYYDILCREDKAAPGLKAGSRKASKAMAEQFDYAGFLSRLFTDPALARQTCFKNDRLMAETCVTNGTVAAYLGIPELVQFLTPEEFETASKIYTAKQFMQHCGSAEQGDWRMHIMDPLVLDFVERADAAVAGNRLAADLRFSHDVGLMPFFSLIGLQGYEKRLPFEEVCDHWNATYMMPMATNLQLVFYRGRKDDILVRVVFNEADSSIPALGPGPFYPWPELRSYLLKQL
ncbi:MAG: hypothetical protein J5640_05275 [Bacteroidales bacterium]|nr:hypothetical protein [Bacteroidales bacterium]